MKDTLLREAQQLGLSLSDEQLSLFCRFGEELLKKNQVMNLTAITQPQAVASLHFADCLALLNIEDFRNKQVIDVGCGAGFPGVPLKIGEPSIRLTLLDSLQKRILWLKETLDGLGVEAQCIASRAEDFKAREQFDIATSRAVARLNVLAELCLPFVKVGGCFLAMKGSAAQQELDEAKHAINILGGKTEKIAEYQIGEAVHRVVVIRKIKQTPTQYPRRFAKIKQQPL